MQPSLPVASRPARGEDEGRTVRLDPQRPCAFCGHVVDVAVVVRLKQGRYDYACRSCAVKTPKH